METFLLQSRVDTALFTPQLVITRYFIVLALLDLNADWYVLS